MNPTYKKYLPYAAAVVLFAILTLVYFKPLLTGKVLRQDDIMRHRAMSKEIFDYREKHGTEPLWTNSMFGGMPAYQISTLYPGNWLNQIDKAFKLYLPHPGGYLFLYFLGFYILALCLRVDPWLSIAGALAYGLSSYFLIIIEAGHNSKANALGYLPALIGGVILLMNGRYWLGLAVTTLFTAMELNANHVQISYYGYILIGFIILGYLFTAFRSKQLKPFAKGLMFFMIATLVALLPNAGNLLVTNEYGKYSTRGPSELTIKSALKRPGLDNANGDGPSLSAASKEKYEKNTTTGLNTDYATQWSYGIDESFTFLIPDYKGGATSSIQQADPKALKKVKPDFKQEVGSSNSYFGEQPFTSGPVYIGAIIIFLAFLGMFIVKHPIKWPVFAATVLTMALGWGKNFMSLTEFFMHNVPGYNKFRAVAMIMVVAELTIPLLAILAVNELLKFSSWKEKVKLRLIKKEIELRKLIFISVGFVGGFCLICYLAPGVFNHFTAAGEEREVLNQYIQAGYPEEQVRPHVAELMPELEKAREHIFTSDAARSLIFILLSFGVIYLYFTDKLKRGLLVAALALFILIDLWTVDTRYLNERSFITKEQNSQSLVQKTSADEEILRDTTKHYRVLNLSSSRWQDALTSYYHKSIGGYHGAKLEKYQELMDFHLDPEINRFYKEANRALGNDSARARLLESMQVVNMLNAKYFILPAGEGMAELPLLNDRANGNAWFVESVIAVPDADEEILRLENIQTKKEAVVQQKYILEAGLKRHYESGGTIRLTSYEPNRLTYHSSNTHEGLAVFSEIYYPKGWNAYVDGQLKPHISVDYVLRALPLPAGEHNIEFRFEPQTYTVGQTIALIGSIITILLVALGIYMDRRNKVIVS
jgi:hypothetical protein